MNICAIICELNPFHNGHEYIFRRAREITSADYVIALMSGNFVQRGFPAITDEYTRAKCAVECGADIALELPAVYAIASADRFASGAINILASLPVTHVAMGTESDGDDVCIAAEIQHKQSEKFIKILKLNLGSANYAKALTAATAATAASDYGKDEAAFASMLAKPNNILAVAYKKALLDSSSDVKFTPIKRIGDETSENSDGRYASASEIRSNINHKEIERTMPKRAYDILISELSAHPVDLNAYSAIMLHSLRGSEVCDIENTPDCAEGFGYKIKELAHKCASYDELLSKLPTSRFTRGRIMRICAETLLGITKEMQNSGYRHTRLLAIKRDALELLGAFPKSVITNKKSESAVPDDMKDIFRIDKKASEVFSIITKAPDSFYRKLPIF